jgi:hypothetical protein
MASPVTERLRGLVGSTAIKPAVRVATTAAITLSGEQTIDGVAVVEGDRVLVKNQSSSAENGIYVCSTGTWARSKDWNGSLDAGDGTLVFVRAGSTNSGLLFKASASTADIVVGTTEVTFTLALSFNVIGLVGALLAAAETEDEALDALGAGATGKELLDAADDDTAIETLLDGATATTAPGNSDTIPLRTSGAAGRAVTVADLLAALPLRGYLAGLTLSRNATATSLDVAAGVARDSTNADFMNLTSAITKSLNANWAVGTGEGGLDTGSKANSTWYHVFLIKRVDTDVVDALFSLSAASPTMPANYTLKRRIGSILTDSSGDIVLFSQNGDEFLWSEAVLDVDITNPGTSAVTRTLSVPTGVKVEAIFTAYVKKVASDFHVKFSALDVTDAAASFTAAPLSSISASKSEDSASADVVGEYKIRTNTSAQIRSRAGNSAAGDILRISTAGWIDRRGRDD